MRFHVSRTSCCPDEKDEPPCPGARWEPFPMPTVYPFKSPEEYDAHWKGREIFGVPVALWREAGQNHRVTAAGIARDFPREGWFIDLEMGDLIAFVADHRKAVIHPPGEDGVPTIEIYDTYRE